MMVLVVAHRSAEMMTSLGVCQDTDTDETLAMALDLDVNSRCLRVLVIAIVASTMNNCPANHMVMN
jgi:hypothetical protein